MCVREREAHFSVPYIACMCIFWADHPPSLTPLVSPFLNLVGPFACMWAFGFGCGGKRDGDGPWVWRRTLVVWGGGRCLAVTHSRRARERRDGRSSTDKLAKPTAEVAAAPQRGRLAECPFVSLGGGCGRTERESEAKEGRPSSRVGLMRSFLSPPSFIRARARVRATSSCQRARGWPGGVDIRRWRRRMSKALLCMTEWRGQGRTRRKAIH